MIAINLKSDLFVDVNSSTTAAEALDIMSSHGLRHIVVVDESRFLGILDEDHILGTADDAPLRSLAEYYDFHHCLPSDHIFEVISKMAMGKLTILPIVTDGQYFGALLLEELFYHIASIYSLDLPGSTFIIEMPKVEYSLAAITRIIESEGATILSTALSSLHDDSSRITVSIKTNSMEAGRLQATLERYNYNVMATYNDEGLFDVLKERYDSLMHYLGV